MEFVPGAGADGLQVFANDWHVCQVSRICAVCKYRGGDTGHNKQ